MNEQYFCRFFKKVIGRSPMEYVNEYRIKKGNPLSERIRSDSYGNLSGMWI